MSLETEKLSSARSIKDELAIITKFSSADFIPDGFDIAEDGESVILTCKGKSSDKLYVIHPDHMELLKKIKQVTIVYSLPDDTLHEALIDRKRSSP